MSREGGITILAEPWGPPLLTHGSYGKSPSLSSFPNEVGGLADRYIEAFQNKDAPMRLLLTREDKDKYNLHDTFEDDNIIGHWQELKKMNKLEVFSEFFFI